LTKARTKGEAKRAKRGKAMPLSDDPEREASGRRQRPLKESNMNTVLDARARHMGLMPPRVSRYPSETDEEFQGRQRAHDAAVRAFAPLLRREWLGCEAGKAIAGEADVAELWAVVRMIRQRRLAYLRAIDAPAEQAKIARMLAASEPMEASPDDPPADLRTEEERAEAAITRWEDLRDVLLDHHAMAVRFVLDRVTGESRASDASPVPKAPLVEILRYVKKRMDA
jgi:hypothetical protein